MQKAPAGSRSIKGTEIVELGAAEPTTFLGPQDNPTRLEVFRWRVEEFLNQGHMMLLILRNHVHNSYPQFSREFEHALLCYGMLQVEMTDYFTAINNYNANTFVQKDLKWWLDTLFTRVAMVLFAVLDKIEVQALDYFVNKDLLKQLFRHLQWDNILFNWRIAYEVSPFSITTFP
ncbi:uncharacterized protein LOC135367288 [Ornithodoros turicata]|uniref:uncharacterized protein LOC135367288 n=1 Tax=Ornithodoros turicata TaxID=34597 RepID=UPI0031386E03